MHLEAYDVAAVAGDQNSSDGESSSDIPLSDDDDLDNDDDEAAVIVPMRRGTLPPELILLYGLCLASEGGKVFLATNASKLSATCRKSRARG